MRYCRFHTVGPRRRLQLLSLQLRCCVTNKGSTANPTASFSEEFARDERDVFSALIEESHRKHQVPLDAPMQAPPSGYKVPVTYASDAQRRRAEEDASSTPSFAHPPKPPRSATANSIASNKKRVADMVTNVPQYDNLVSKGADVEPMPVVGAPLGDEPLHEVDGVVGAANLGNDESVMYCMPRRLKLSDGSGYVDEADVDGKLRDGMTGGTTHIIPPEPFHRFHCTACNRPFRTRAAGQQHLKLAHFPESDVTATEPTGKILDGPGPGFHVPLLEDIDTLSERIKQAQSAGEDVRLGVRQLMQRLEREAGQASATDSNALFAQYWNSTAYVDNEGRRHEVASAADSVAVDPVTGAIDESKIPGLGMPLKKDTTATGTGTADVPNPFRSVGGGTLGVPEIVDGITLDMYDKKYSCTICTHTFRLHSHMVDHYLGKHGVDPTSDVIPPEFPQAGMRKGKSDEEEEKPRVVETKDGTTVLSTASSAIQPPPLLVCGHLKKAVPRKVGLNFVSYVPTIAVSGVVVSTEIGVPADAAAGDVEDDVIFQCVIELDNTENDPSTRERIVVRCYGHSAALRAMAQTVTVGAIVVVNGSLRMNYHTCCPDGSNTVARAFPHIRVNTTFGGSVVVLHKKCHAVML